MNHDEYDKKCLKTMMQIREQLKLQNHIEILRELYNLDAITTEEYKYWFATIAVDQGLGKIKGGEEDVDKD